MAHAGFIGYLLPLYGLLLYDTVRRRRRWSAVFESCAMGALVALPLTLIALRVMTATRGLVLAALVECGAVVGLGLAYMWSPAATNEPNAVLAASEHVRFLGQQTWPLGVLILLAGATVISRVAFSLVGSQPARLQPKPRSSTLDAA